MANYIYDNKLVENKYQTVLNTKLLESEFMTIDENLAAQDGDVVEVVTRSVSGSFEDVAMGVGNSGNIEVTGIRAPYQVKVKQGRFVYYDEEARKDSKVVDTGIEGMGEIARNAWMAEAIAEAEKAYTYNVTSSSIGFNDFVDAGAKFGEEDTDILALVHPTTMATIRKNLKDDLKYSEGYARTGYVGTVAGIPVKVSKAIPQGEVIVLKKDAVTLFLKKDTEIEQDRDANTRKNMIFSRKCAICALTKEDHVVRIAAGATTTATITTYTKAQKTVAGAATTGANVRVFVNGVLKKTTTAASSAYSVTLDDNLAAGDKVMIIAHKDGEVASKAEVTVAA